MATPRDGDLILAEEVLLLAYDDERGKDGTSWGIDAGLAGSLLIDLGEAGCVRVEGKELVATGRPAPDHPLLADALDRISQSDKRRTAKGWLDKLRKEPAPLKERVVQGLVDRGVLREEERRMLRIFRTTHYPEANPEPERVLRERLSAVVLGERAPAPRDVLLLSVLQPYDMVKELAPNDRRREAKARAKEIADRGVAGKAVEDAIKEVEAAIMAAIVATTVVTAAGSS